MAGQATCPTWRRGAECAQSNVAISDDGRTIASSGDGEIYLYDRGGKVLWKSVSAFFGYGRMRMSREGKYLAHVNPTGEWFLLSKDRRIVNRTPLLTPEPNSLALTPDGQRAVIAGIGCDVCISDHEVE
jgi:hypothetical protein